MPFPCFVVEMENEGIVSIPIDGKPGLVVLSDSDLAERFSTIVREARHIAVSPVELTESKLLKCVLTAKNKGVSFLAIDPEKSGERFICRMVSIDDVIRELESHAD